MNNILKKLLRFAKPYKLYGILNIISNVLYAFFNVLSIIIFIPTLGILFDNQEEVFEKPVYQGFSNLKGYAEDSLNYFLTQKVTDDGPMAALVFICLASIVIFFLKNLFRYMAMYFLAFLRTGMVKDIQDSLYHKVVDLPISFFSEKRKGDLLARMTSDVKEVESSIINSLEALVREPITIVIVLISMLLISAKLTLFVFIFLPITGFIISAVGKRLKAQSLAAQKENGVFLSFLEETLTGLKVIKGFNAEGKLAKKFTDSTERFKNIMNSVLQRKGLASPLSEFLGVAVVITVLWYGGSLVFDENSGLKPQDFMGYIGLFYTIINPVKAITTVNYSIKKGNAAGERIFEILETENSIKEPVNPTEIEKFDTGIDFKNVSFGYENENVLEGFNLKVNKGHTVALVGQSGSGKSTVANLVTRFYDVNEGSIEIDGINIKDISKKSLRELMGLVTQDSILFNDSVKNNIGLGKTNATEEEIVEAAKITNAHDFIMELPEGYNTNIGDGGNKLSGGQKQRLSIARAVLKNPPIMILDEATSALDTESERLVQDALEKMMRNRTSIVIAHRLSTIQNADSIVVMSKGKILEQGTHQELMKSKKGYKKLVEMQTMA
ncbi:ABC transporter ATP-binding protein/permease [Muricauda sp. SCSIO 64092]|uniref:ABC transporter ATP-binding protein n=1 Tax=Allomuricauda sp. SCSIO 64092 TaxID=2908842 RepID=UPI001FF60C1A|nr:ABC transporter ATP-binding protein [Muricauda sp. SCSIO 64092]UOY07037.1 ABC transporter ATP-binding protein/permease [Muricauda sp. SCSIO 64092]